MRVLVLILALAGVLLGQCVAPYSIEQVERLLQGGVVPVRVRALVRQCGVEFAITPALERRLRSAGATDGVIEAVREKGGMTPSPPAAAVKPAAPSFAMEFVGIPAGEFMMGCSPGDEQCASNERPAHRVRITKPFEMGKYEVTQAQWEAVMGANPSHFRGADRPVEQVSWEDAQQFLSRLNARNDGYRYRLPTEAEWEYAARAGTTGSYYGDLSQIAWYDGNSGSQTQPVGRKQPNAWGLYDMLGSVYEWCSDLYGARYYRSSPQTDPKGPDSGQVRALRGGSWDGSPGSLRVSYRVGVTPGDRDFDLGFRCVRERFP